MNKYLPKAVIVCLFIVSTLVPAYGSSWHRLAYSKKLGADVFVYQAGDTWCKKTVSSKVNLNKTSPLLQGGMDSFLSKVVTLLQKECPSANSAKFEIFGEDGKTLISSYASSAKTKWLVQKVVPEAKSLDDLAESPKETASPTQKKPKKDKAESTKVKPVEIKPVEAKSAQLKPVEATFLSLLPIVMPDSQTVLSKPEALNDYLGVRYCKKYQQIKNNEIKLARLASDYKSEASAFFDAEPPE
ncbi:MAG: hypothetical protein GY729_20780, partial [Desulfobacteraceae bacterium]|nr:hypothetical protein [Desulfobacteraceae bacterium]